MTDQREHLAREGIYRPILAPSGPLVRFYRSVSLMGLVLIASLSFRPAYGATEEFKCPLPVQINPDLRALSKEQLIRRLAKISTSIARYQNQRIVDQGARQLSESYQQIYPDQRDKINQIVSEEFNIMLEPAFEKIEKAIFDKTERSFPLSDYLTLISIMEDKNFNLLMAARNDSLALRDMNAVQASAIRECVYDLDHTRFNYKIIKQSIGDFALMGSIMGTIDGPKLHCRVMQRFKTEGFDVSSSVLENACKVNIL